ncbi:hypothetical protein CRG98_037456 [Punica granatum]|uniref:Uncharacterized protein n=1 Tax=Punica granatum TaxID=22663 RepID=A0A2I0IEP9_PUNGR|nr:hypothetical protein CRG98_037456 [Punica granatum]
MKKKLKIPTGRIGPGRDKWTGPSKRAANWAGLGRMDRWASGRGWAGPNANGLPLLDWAEPLLDWAVAAGPCRKLGCSRCASV